MPSYDKAPAEVPALVAELIAAHHPALAEAAITVECLQATAPVKKSGMKSGPALKLHGWPCAAIVNINPEKKRAEGVADATITIDGDQWPDWDENKRRALIDHELLHLDVARDKYGVVKEDGLGRPKLKMRPHDWEITGFQTIAERYGDDSFEVQEAERLFDTYGQILFPWGETHESRTRVKGSDDTARQSRPADRTTPAPSPYGPLLASHEGNGGAGLLFPGPMAAVGR